MTGGAGAAVALAAAVLVAPGSPRRRLVPAARRRLPLRAVFGVGWCALILMAFVACGVAAAMSVAVLAGVVTLRLRRRRALRGAAQDAQSMAAALEVLVSELRIGAHPVRAFGVAASESRGEVAQAFREVAARASLGADVPAGLRCAATQSSRPADWERMAVFWQLAVEHGLAIAMLMRAAQRDIVERQRFCSRVEAGMAGARATASILAGLPLLGVALGQLIGAQPLSFLLGGGAGGWFLLIGTVLVCSGLLWADHITGRVTA